MTRSPRERRIEMAGTDREPEEQGPPSYQLATWLVIGGVIVLIIALVGVRLEHQPDTARDYPPRPMIPDGPTILLASPEMDDEYLPCSDCHEDEPTNRTPRELEDDHEDRVIEHGDLWCLSCHDADNRDFLHLADGTLVKFEESWKLCTQCHGSKLADWRAGVHGKRTGHWRGPKEYRPCVTCHNPHSPPFEAIAPKPPPVRPEDIGRGPRTAGSAGEDEHGPS